MANVQLKLKLPKRPTMKSKRYDVEKIENDQKVADCLKVSIGGAYTSQIALGDLKIYQLRKKFENEIFSTNKNIVRINPKTKT